MPNSKADAATPAPDAGTPGAEAKNRARPDRRASAEPPAPPNGITITRWGLGISLTLALGILGGAFMLVWNRTAGLDDRMWSLQDQVADMRAEIGVVRHEVGSLREDMTAIRQDMSAIREQVQEIAILIRTRAAPADAQ